MGMIENYIADLENVEDLYNQNWVIPFSSAYVIAHDKFKETLDSQSKLDQLKLDLFLTAATIGFGAGLGAMFGKTAVKTIARDQAMNFICDRNMNRAFNLMHRVSNSVPGTYLVEQVWDTVASKVGDAAKKEVASLLTTPVTSAGSQNPQLVQNDMTAYVLRAKTAAHQLAASIRDSTSLSPAEKDAFATAMRGADFFRKCPTRDIIGDRQTAADILELSFYMVLVMNTDYLEESVIGFAGAHESMHTRRLGAVTVATTDANYNAGTGTTTRSGLGFSQTRSTYVAYDSIGSNILDRINVLYQARFREDFQRNRFYDSTDSSKAAVGKAERTIEQLNGLVLNMVPR